MSQDRIQFMMMEKIHHFESFEDRLRDLETRNVVLEENFKIMKNQLEKLTQNTNLIVEPSGSGSNYAENPFENVEILPDHDPGQFVNQSAPLVILEDDEVLTDQVDKVQSTDAAGIIENQGSNFTHHVEIKSEGNEWTCNSNTIEENVEIFPASSTSSPKMPTILISSEREFRFYKSNLNLFSQYKQKVPKILQNVVIPLIRIDPNKDGNPYSCSICCRKFSNNSSLTRHLQRSLHSNMTRCKICSKSFKTRHYLNSHMKIHNPLRERNYKCPNCSKTFYTFRESQIHNRIHTGEKPYSCSVCEKKFNQHSNLVSHQRIHIQNHNEENTTGNNFVQQKRKFICKVCFRVFKFQQKLDLHMQIHNSDEEKTFKCPTCFKLYSNFRLLKIHLQIHTERPYSCSICGKRFTQESSLSRHKMIHRGEKPYSCSECSQKFTQSQSLTRHMSQIHNKDKVIGEKLYSCSECPEKFPQFEGLVLHKRVHIQNHNEGKKSYSCSESECPEKFIESESLVRHMGIHNDAEKPYKCEFCPKSFLLKDYLVIHTRCHTGEKPYECSTCHNKFISKSILNKHQQDEHQNIPIEIDLTV